MTEDPREVAREYFHVKEEIKNLEKKRVKLKESLFNFFDSENTNKIRVEDMEVYRVQMVRTKWNEDILKYILKQKGFWENVLSVDNAKVKDLIQKGLISESELDEAKIVNETWYTYTRRTTKKPEKNNSRFKNIIITDLSRMKGDRVCIFGFDEQGSPIRPVIPFSGVREKYLFDENDQLVLRPGSEVQLELLQRVPKPPHNEDFVINGVRKPVLIRNLSQLEMKDLFEKILFDSVLDIFSCPIIKNRCIGEANAKRSLGTVKAEEVIFVEYGQKNGKMSYRLKFTDKIGDLYDLPVTDCAFRKHCDSLKVKYHSLNMVGWHVKQEFNEKDVYLRVGLTRIYKGVHWLQVSGVHSFPDYKGN